MQGTKVVKGRSFAIRTGENKQKNSNNNNKTEENDLDQWLVF